MCDIPKCNEKDHHLSYYGHSICYKCWCKEGRYKNEWLKDKLGIDRGRKGYEKVTIKSSPFRDKAIREYLDKKLHESRVKESK